MYGIEINLPFQVQEDFKYRVMVQLALVDDSVKTPSGEVLTNQTHRLSYTEKPNKAFNTDDKESADALAETYAPSWDATVVPAEGGVELTAEELKPIIEKERLGARARVRAERALSR